VTIKKKWAFIYTSDGCLADRQHCTIEGPHSTAYFVGTGSVEEGCLIAKQLVEQGCQLLELCGGFGAAGARQVIAAIDGRVPVGYIDYFPEELLKVQQTT